jgi:hypothetical protein
MIAREHARGSAVERSVDMQIYAVVPIREGKLRRYREFHEGRSVRQAAGCRLHAQRLTRYAL